MGGVLFLAGRGPLHNQSRKDGTIHVLPEDYCPGTAHLHGGRVDHLRHMLQEEGGGNKVVGMGTGRFQPVQ